MSDQEGRDEDAAYEREERRRAAVVCDECGGRGGTHDSNCPGLEDIEEPRDE